MEVEGEGADELAGPGDNLVVGGVRHGSRRRRGRAPAVPAPLPSTAMPLARGPRIVGDGRGARASCWPTGSAARGWTAGTGWRPSPRWRATRTTSPRACCGGLVARVPTGRAECGRKRLSSQVPSLRPVVLVPSPSASRTRAAREALPADGPVRRRGVRRRPRGARGRRADRAARPAAGRASGPAPRAVPAAAGARGGRAARAAPFPRRTRCAWPGSGPSLLAFETRGPRGPRPGSGWRGAPARDRPGGAHLDRRLSADCLRRCPPVCF